MAPPPPPRAKKAGRQGRIVLGLAGSPSQNDADLPRAMSPVQKKYGPGPGIGPQPAKQARNVSVQVFSCGLLSSLHCRRLVIRQVDISAMGTERHFWFAAALQSSNTAEAPSMQALATGSQLARTQARAS